MGGIATEGLVRLDGRWPLGAVTGGDLRREGTIGRVWQWIDEANEQRLALTELSVRGDHAITDPSRHGAGAGQLGGARPRWTAAMIDAEGGSDDRRNAFS